jgi:hypothetical protein
LENKSWIPIIIDYIYDKEDMHENIFAHAKLVHGKDYYEVMIPELEFKTMYIRSEKISSFL